MKFKVIGPGYTPIVIEVASIHDIDGRRHLDQGRRQQRRRDRDRHGPEDPDRDRDGHHRGHDRPDDGILGQTFTPLPTTVPVSGTTTIPVLNPVTAVPVVSGPATVPFNTGVFSVTSIGNVPVGAIGTVQVVVDNAWEPNFADTYVDITYDPSMIRYFGLVDPRRQHDGRLQERRHGPDHARRLPERLPPGEIPAGRHHLHGPPRGDHAPGGLGRPRPGPGTVTLPKFTDISSSASTQNGTFSTGPVAATVATLAPVTGNPSVTYETVVPIGTVRDRGPRS